MTFKREVLTYTLLDEIVPLLQLHWKEVAHFKDIELSPDRDMYVKLEESGALRFFSYRDKDGEIIGYAVFVIRQSIHYSSSVQAVQDVLFIHPEKRGYGKRFIKWCDDELKAEGVEVVYHHVKQAHNFGPMLERIGYELVDLIYARRVN